MRKAVLIVLMACASSIATAAWERVGENKEYTGYADATTLRKTGHLAQVWVLFDYKAPQQFEGKSFLSVREQFEFDCRVERLQLLAVVAHPENMARGKVVYSAVFEHEEWQKLRRGTMHATLRQFACGKN